MRVLYFSRDYTPHDYRFLTSLVGSGQGTYFLRLERSGRALEDRALPPEVHQVAWKGGQKPFAWGSLPELLTSLRSVLRQVQPDVLHAGPIQTAAFLGALAGFRPMVSMSWGSDLLKDADHSGLYRWITRFTLARSQALVGDCAAVRVKAASFGLPDERIYTFPWGIDLERFSPLESAPPAIARPARELPSRLGWQDQFVVLSLRSWEPVYGVDVMLRGFAWAAAQAPNLRLIMLGGGSQAPLIQTIIEENGLRDRVYLGGQVNQNDLPHMFRASDLYVSASHSDGSSVSLMEALGCGLPVVLSDIPSNREWVREGEQGWFFPDGDESALAKVLFNAVSQPQALSQMATAARLRAEQSANWDKNFQVLLEAYRYAVERGQAG